MPYRCDRCGGEHELDDYTKVKNKHEYIKPYSCYEGDYWQHLYYWFACDCGRAIKVEDEDITDPWLIEMDYTEHYGVSTLKS